MRPASRRKVEGSCFPRSERGDIAGVSYAVLSGVRDLAVPVDDGADVEIVGQVDPEPLAGIDPIAVAEIRDLIAHLKDRGIGVLITDHNVRDTLGIVDRAYILHDGKVLMEGTPHDIVDNDDVRRVYLGEKFRL